MRHQILRYFRTPLIGLALLLITLLGFSLAVPSLFDEISPGGGVKSLAIRINSLFSSDDASFNYREAFWRESFKELLGHPIFGIGLGKDVTFPIANYTLTFPVREMHNSIFALTVQTGLLGLIAFAHIIWRAFRKVKWRLRDQIVPAAALLGILIASLFGTYFEANFLILFFWVALAWVGASVIHKSAS